MSVAVKTAADILRELPEDKMVTCVPRRVVGGEERFCAIGWLANEVGFNWDEGDPYVCVMQSFDLTDRQINRLFVAFDLSGKEAAVALLDEWKK